MPASGNLAKLRAEYEAALQLKKDVLAGKVEITEATMERIATTAMLQFQIKQLEEQEIDEPEEEASPVSDTEETNGNVEDEEDVAEPEQEPEPEAEPTGQVADATVAEDQEEKIEPEEEEEEVAPPPKPKQKPEKAPKKEEKPVAKPKPAPKPKPIPEEPQFTVVRYSAEKDKEPAPKPKPEPIELPLPLARAKRAPKKREYTILQRTAVSRLQREFQDLQRHPLAGVAAAPTEHDILEWEVKIAPRDGILVGCVIPLVIVFPDAYPFEPPKIRANTDLSHLFPSVIRGHAPNEFEICLDIFKTDPGFRFAWNSSYTAASICTQLQLVFATEASEQAKKAYKGNWPAAVEVARKALAGDSPIVEEEIPEVAEAVAWDNDLHCFFTRLTYKQSTLGIGVHVDRTNLAVEGFSSGLDLLSIEAFASEKVRKGIANDTFEHFLPLPLTPEHTVKALPLIERAFVWFPRDQSLLYEPPFKPAVVIRLLPLLIHSLVSQTLAHVHRGHLAQQYTDKLIFVFYQLHYMLLELAQKHAAIAADAQKLVQQALDEPSAPSSLPPHDLPILALLTETPWEQLLSLAFSHVLLKTKKAVVRDVFHIKDVKPSLGLRSLLAEHALLRVVSRNTLESYRSVGSSIPTQEQKGEMWHTLSHIAKIDSWEGFTDAVCDKSFTAETVMALVEEHGRKEKI